MISVLPALALNSGGAGILIIGLIIIGIVAFFVLVPLFLAACLRLAVRLGRLLGILEKEKVRDETEKADKILRGPVIESEGKSSQRSVQRKADDLYIGGVQIPTQAEGQHILFSGSTGTGKSQGIGYLLSAIRSRKSRAILIDASGDYLSKFYQRGDAVFNPFDERSVDWSPFAEIRNDFDCSLIAKAVIPDGQGEQAEWHHYAQSLFGETLLKLHQTGIHSVKQLLFYTTAADRKELEEFLGDTPAASMCKEDNDKMLGSVRAIMGSFLHAWRSLQDKGKFSIRDWVRNETGAGWLYITYRDDQFAMLRTLVSTLLDLSFIEGLSLDINPNRDLWFVMDEVDSLGKVNSLSTGLSRFRKYGCKCILGIQTISQLRATYGSDSAQTVMANLGTKLILRAGDGETAEYLSKEIGDQEIRRIQETSGMSGGHSTTSETFTHDNQRTVLPSELMMLPDLTGFLKGSSTLFRVELRYQEYPKVAASFVPKNQVRR